MREYAEELFKVTYNHKENFIRASRIYPETEISKREGNENYKEYQLLRKILEELKLDRTYSFYEEVRDEIDDHEIAWRTIR